MSGAVELPEAAVEFGLWVLDYAFSRYLSLGSCIRKLKEDIEDKCTRNKVRFDSFKFQVVHSMAVVEWFSRPQSDFPADKRGRLKALFLENAVAQALEETDYWVLFFIERRYQEELLEVFRKYYREYVKIRDYSLQPDIGDKLAARIKSVFTGTYKPEGSIRLAEGQVIHQWMEQYRRYYTEPECIAVLSRARLDDRMLASLMSLYWLRGARYVK